MKAKKNKILVVDDEPEIRRIIVEHFAPRRYDVREAANGARAIESIKNTLPDLIILDILMPVMDGFEFLEKIRKNSVYSDIPVIVLTAKSDPPNLAKGISLDASFYLPKPFKLSNLTKFVNLILKD